MAFSPGIAFNLTIISLVTGAMFLMWLGEQITEKGIGNGISMLIFAGYGVAFLPRLGPHSIYEGQISGVLLLVVGLIAVGVVACIITWSGLSGVLP